MWSVADWPRFQISEHLWAVNSLYDMHNNTSQSTKKQNIWMPCKRNNQNFSVTIYMLIHCRNTYRFMKRSSKRNQVSHLFCASLKLKSFWLEAFFKVFPPSLFLAFFVGILIFRVYQYIVDTPDAVIKEQWRVILYT